MALDNPKVHANMVGEYQASGIPWVTESNVASGVTAIRFSHVTRDFTVRNNGTADIFVGFSANGVQGANYFSLAPSGSYEGMLRTKDLFISASATTSITIIAGLTRIPRTQYPTLTGSAGFEGVG